MNKLEMQVAALMRLCTAEDNESYEAAKEEVKRLMACPGKRSASGATSCGVSHDKKNLDMEIRWTLAELGVPSHLVGYPFLVQAITLVAKDADVIRKMFKEGGLYHTLGEQFHTTENRIERGIRHCIDTAWVRCNFEVLNRYFKNTLDPSRGKASNTEFIAQVANVIRMRMDQ